MTYRSLAPLAHYHTPLCPLCLTQQAGHYSNRKWTESHSWWTNRSKLFPKC